MVKSTDPISPSTFTNFGDLLKYLRRREHLTQLELSIKVGYSEAQISRLEKNQRLPDPTGVKALFIPALHLQDDPEFAARLLELAESARQAEAPSPGIAPYKGLLYFDEPDADLFFGRQAITALLVKHVMDLALRGKTRFLAVVGASGSGKSSLVRAGLAVTLRKAGWNVVVFTPTAHPVQLLEGKMSSIHQEETERALILVDQFEEVFTLCHDEVERIGFIDQLLSYAQENSSRYSVVIALRADFYAHCSQYPLLRQAVAAEQEYIGQMTFDELRQAIEEPGNQNGWELEPGLVDVMLQDLSAHGAKEPEPGALPLLSHALLATWEHRRGRKLTLEGYHASGGVRGAIAETAESVFTDQLNQQQQEIAREVFLRLTELGEGTEDTRRRAALAELGEQFEEATQFRGVLNTLAEARLVTLNEDSAEVAHEALIREWGRLHEWLTQDREGLLLHRHLTEAAHEWERRGRDPAELYRGARLAQANEWASATDVRLYQIEREFLTASMEQEQHEALQREAQRQRELEAAKSLAEAERQRAEEHKQSEHHLRRRAIYLGFALMGVFLLLMAAVVLYRQANTNAGLANQNAGMANQSLATAQSAEQQALGQQATAESQRLRAEEQANQRATAEAVAVQEKQTAEQQTRLATARELASASRDNLQTDQERSLLLAMQAVRTADIPEAENALHQAIANMRLRDSLQAHAQAVYGIDYKPGDGQEPARLATAGEEGTIKIWELDETGLEIIQPPLITISNTVEPLVSQNSTGGTLAFSSDGKKIASVSKQNTVKIWDVDSVALLKTLSAHQGLILGVAYSPIEGLVATSGQDGTVKIWDALSGEELQTLTGFSGEAGPLAFSPDGKRLACGESWGSKLIVWDRTDETGIPANSSWFTQSFTIEDPDGVFSIAFSPDGTQIALANVDITVYDIASASAATPARQLHNIKAHSNLVNGLYFSPDGMRLISGSADQTAKVWDVQSGQLIFTLAASALPISSLALSEDGEQLYTANYNGQVKVWDLSLTGNQEWITIPEVLLDFETRSANRLVTPTINPSGYRVVEFSSEGWREISGIVPSIAFSNTLVDSNQALTELVTLGINESIVHVWDMSTGMELNSFPVTQTLTQAGHVTPDFSVIKISPDGVRLVTSGWDGSAYLWDVQNGKMLFELPGGSAGYGSWDPIEFSPDSSQVAIADYNGTLYIWDVQTGELLHDLQGHAGPFPNISFNEDGTLLLATGEGSKVNLWDLRTGKLLLTLPELPTLVDNLAISPDGKYLAVSRIDQVTQVWDGATGQELLTLPGQYVRFSQDGKYLLDINYDVNQNNLHGYILDINELMDLAESRLTRTLTQEECQKYLHTEVCPTTE